MESLIFQWTLLDGRSAFQIHEQYSFSSQIMVPITFLVDIVWLVCLVKSYHKLLIYLCVSQTPKCHHQSQFSDTQYLHSLLFGHTQHTLHDGYMLLNICLPSEICSYHTLYILWDFLLQHLFLKSIRGKWTATWPSH